MDAYIYQADLHCEKCAEEILDRLPPEAAQSRYPEDFPKGPFPDGGGESDHPQHCGTCGLFLENPLTGDGMIYVQNAIAEFRQHGLGDKTVTDQWYEFYNLSLFEVE